MELKKNPAHDLRRKSPLFLGLGFIVSCTAVIIAFEWQFLYVPPAPPYEDSSETWVASLEKTVVTEEKKKLETPKLKRPVTPTETSSEDKQKEELKSFEPDSTSSTGPKVIAIEPPDDLDMDKIHLIVEESPEPVDGYRSFYDQIGKTLKYPKAALKRGIEGKVFVEFVVDRQGQPTEMKVLKGIGGGCDEEAMRAIAQSKWKPGKQRGRPVMVRMVLPIVFTLHN